MTTEPCQLLDILRWSFQETSVGSLSGSVLIGGLLLWRIIEASRFWGRGPHPKVE